MSLYKFSFMVLHTPHPADTSIWSAIIFTRDNTALGRLTVRRTIAFVGGDFRVLLRFKLTSPFFTSVVHDCQALFCLLFSCCPRGAGENRLSSTKLRPGIVSTWFDRRQSRSERRSAARGQAR